MKQILKAPKSVLETNDFGVTISETGVQIKVWAPCAIRARVAIYNEGDDLFRNEIPMESIGDGIFNLNLPLSYKNKYYTYIITSAETDYEVVDPYAVAAGPNSEKAMIIDLEDTNPTGWHSHDQPHAVKAHEALVYELHVRDFSSDPNSGMYNKGKYLAFTEKNTSFNGLKTGIDHLKELGITHVHLLPVYDFSSIDELDASAYNWGYDPELFNVPEGSYSTNPLEGHVRIQELKLCIMALHEAGIRVVLDMVYNHTYASSHSNFNRLAPGYFYRHTSDGSFSNGSGCGNELATERSLVRKFIIDSLLFWLKEYKVDGFRFDLMALYDVETVQEISRVLHENKPDILLYGEPWIGWESVLPETRRFVKTKQAGLKIALFNDDFRNAIKGDNDGHESGFVMGLTSTLQWVQLGIAASTELSGGRKGFAEKAEEVVNYVSAHDNLVLWDKIDKVCPSDTIEDKIRMHRLALAIVLTSFGVAFIQSGTEFLRSKKGHENSYNAGDEINKIDWISKSKHFNHFTYIKNLITFRRFSGFFKWNAYQEIKNNVSFLDTPEGIIGYEILNDNEDRCIVLHNGTRHRKPVQLPEGKFYLVANEVKVDLNSSKMFSTFGERPVHIEGFTTMILTDLDLKSIDAFLN